MISIILLKNVRSKIPKVKPAFVFGNGFYKHLEAGARSNQNFQCVTQFLYTLEKVLILNIYI